MSLERSAYDLVVLGAGSGGFAAARTARELGASVAFVDKGPLGGLCILRGCMPSKTLLASSDALYDMREAGDLGIHANGISIDVVRVIARKRELVREFADYRIEGIRAFPLYEGQARFVSPRELRVGNAILEAKKFIVATGSVVAPPALTGLAETGYFDSDAALERASIPETLVVLGGGYVACELGQYFARMGAKTTMVIRSGHLLSAMDHDIGETLTECFRNEGITIVDRATLLRAEARGAKKAVRIVVDGVEGDLEADEIFYALGRVPDIEGLDLEAAGIAAHPITGISVDAFLQTSNQNVYAVGDVTGEFALVHVAIYQGEIAARNAVLGIKERAVYDLVKAHTIFSDPQVAVVGKSERDLEREGTPYVSGRYDFAEHGKAQTLGKTKGFVKVLAAPEDGRILGAAIVGPHGSDLIHEMIVAMSYGSTVGEFVRIPHLHPTLAEIWTYPAEECADKIELAARKVARSGTAG